MVKWNEPYQKLASCDSTGIIFVWIKYEGRWSIELINDRNTPVTSFSWSHDGRMALICYQVGPSFYPSSLTEQHVRIRNILEEKIIILLRLARFSVVALNRIYAEFLHKNYHFTKFRSFSCWKYFLILLWNCETIFSAFINPRESKGSLYVTTRHAPGNVLINNAIIFP